MNPRTLERALRNRLPEDLAISPEDKAKWCKDPCAVAVELDALHELQKTWEQMLRATTWEEFVELRGVYKGLEIVLDLPAQITVALSDRLATTQQDADRASQTMKDICHE